MPLIVAVRTAACETHVPVMLIQLQLFCAFTTGSPSTLMLSAVNPVYEGVAVPLSSTYPPSIHATCAIASIALAATLLPMFTQVTVPSVNTAFGVWFHTGAVAPVVPPTLAE